MKGSNVRSYVSRLRLLFIIINICQEYTQVRGVRKARMNLNIQFPEIAHFAYISHPIQGSCTTDMDEGRHGELMLFLRGIGRNELYMLKNPGDNPSHADAVVKPGSVRWRRSWRRRKGFIFKFCPRMYGVYAVSCEYISAKARGDVSKVVKAIFLVEKPILKVLYHEQPNIAFLGGKLTVNCLAAVGSFMEPDKGKTHTHGELALVVSGGSEELKWVLRFVFFWHQDATYSGWKVEAHGSGSVKREHYWSMTREFDVKRGYIYNAVFRLLVTEDLENSTFTCWATNFLRSEKTQGISQGLVIKDTPVNMNVHSRMAYSRTNPPLWLIFVKCNATEVNTSLAMAVKTVSQTHVYMANRKNGETEYKKHVFKNPNYKGITPKVEMQFKTNHTRGFSLEMNARFLDLDPVKVSCHAEHIQVCEKLSTAPTARSQHHEEDKTVSHWQLIFPKFVVLVVLGLCIALFIIAANTVRKKSPAVEK